MISEREFVLSNFYASSLINLRGYDTIKELKKSYKHICKNTSDSVPTQNEKIDAVIEKLNKKHFMRTEEIVKMLEGLKNA